MHLLVVDADPSDRAVTCRALADGGLGDHVDEASSHAEALAALARARYDAILVDQELAGTPGLDLVRAIRSAGDPRTAVIYLTASVNEDLLQAAANAGVTDFLYDADRTPRRLALRVQFAVRGARSESELAASSRDAQRAVAARDELLAVVSHDLRGPLHAIGLALEVLRDEVSENGKKFIGAIERASQRAELLISDLLEASAIENGAIQLSRHPADAAAIVRQATADHELAAKASGGAITASLPADRVVVDCDRDRVLQVLNNLIGNALKHARGAPIEISVEREPTCGAARIAVRDRGPGIAAAELPHVFDRYWRGRTRKGGAGLGLAIAKGIVVAHGGEISVHSAPGGGAEFAFTLPLAQARTRTDRA